MFFLTNLDGACWEIITLPLQLNWMFYIIELASKRSKLLHPPPSPLPHPPGHPRHPCWQRSRCNGSQSGGPGLHPGIEQAMATDLIHSGKYLDKSKLGASRDENVHVGLKVGASPHCQDGNFHLRSRTSCCVPIVSSASELVQNRACQCGHRPFPG